MKHVIVYMTAAREEEALAIGHALVEERLAACVNVLGRVRSIFSWQGKLDDGDEVSFIAKTRAALVPALVERVKALHSYETPCVVAVPIVGGSPAFLAWIDSETRAPAGG